MSRTFALLLAAGMALLLETLPVRASIVAVQVNPSTKLNAIDFFGVGRPDIAFRPGDSANPVILNLAPNGVAGNAFAIDPHFQGMQNNMVPTPQMPGHLIGPSDDFVSGASNAAPLTSLTAAPGSSATTKPAVSTDPKYVGLRVVLADGQTHYAWVQYQANPVTGDDPQTYSISAYAYESTPNVGIPVGAVPEPTSICAMMIGAAGMCLRRRRR